MAKIEFTAQEIEVLKKTAEIYHDNGAEKAKAYLSDSGLTLDVSSEAKELVAPVADSAANGTDNCYACLACVFTSAVALISFTR